MCSSDLGILAAERALADAELLPESVDLVITATISPDQIMPATAARVAYKTGCVNAGAFDVSAGCTGFVYALAMAAGAVASGFYEKVLVVGAEAISQVLDWDDRAGAAVISAAPASAAGSRGAADLAASAAGQASLPAGKGILGFDLGNDGSGVDMLSIPAGGSRLPASRATVDEHQHFVKMNGREVYKFATRIVAGSAGRVLERCGRTVEEIDLFVPHQANLRIIDAASKKLRIPEDRICTNLERYGNTSCASIPLCLHEARAEGKLREGALVLLMGFGAGLSWGACLLEWNGGR
jgi:3-oxoacyl-[acyl-carrier-protein] synthase-3